MHSYRYIYTYIHTYISGGACGVMVIVVGNGHEIKSWTRLIAFSHSTNTLGKGMNPIIIPPAMGKIVRQTRFFSLGKATSLGEEIL